MRVGCLGNYKEKGIDTPVHEGKEEIGNCGNVRFVDVDMVLYCRKYPYPCEYGVSECDCG